MRVFIVEDEIMLVLMCQEVFPELGFEIVSYALTIADATTQAEIVDADFALLDVNVAGVISFDVASILQRRGIPILFTTGYWTAAVSERFPGVPVLTKPYADHELVAAVLIIMEKKNQTVRKR